MMLLNAFGEKYNKREIERVKEEHELLLRRPSISQLGMQFFEEWPWPWVLGVLNPIRNRKLSSVGTRSNCKIEC